MSSGDPDRRVLCVTSNFPRWPGDSTTPFILHLAHDLQDLGWQVDVLAPHAEGTRIREILDGVQVERFRYLWPASAETVCYEGGALIKLRERRSSALKIPFLVASELASVLRRLASSRYALLHSHWILPQGFTGVISARPLRIPHVVTVHGGDIFALRGRLFERLKRYTLERADVVTVNSSVTRRAVLRTAPKIRDLRLIPMGVAADTQSVAPQMAADLRKRFRRGEGPLLVFAGRLVGEKGIDDLMKAIDLLRHDLPDVTGVIVGDGPHRGGFEALSMRLGISDRVFFAGWVATDVMPTYLSVADAFVAPSRRAPDGWMEAQGLAVIEAMVAGTPVIATRTGGIVDAVVHEQTGLLVAERSPTEIAEAVRRLARDPRLSEELRTRARAHASRRFSRGASGKAFAGLFEDLVTSRARNASNG